MMCLKFESPGSHAVMTHLTSMASTASLGSMKARPPTSLLRQQVSHATLARVLPTFPDQKNCLILLVTCWTPSLVPPYNARKYRQADMSTELVMIALPAELSRVVIQYVNFLSILESRNWFTSCVVMSIPNGAPSNLEMSVGYAHCYLKLDAQLGLLVPPGSQKYAVDLLSLITNPDASQKCWRVSTVACTYTSSPRMDREVSSANWAIVWQVLLPINSIPLIRPICSSLLRAWLRISPTIRNKYGARG